MQKTKDCGQTEWQQAAFPSIQPAAALNVFIKAQQPHKINHE